MFNPNLIIIKNKKNILGIQKIKHDYTKKDYYIEIKDINNSSIFTGKIDSTTLIEVSSQNKITITYYEDSTKKEFDTETFNLPVLYPEVKEDEIATNDMVEKVRYEMDNPKGTIHEIEDHTLKIKKSAYDIDARNYVISKIKYVLLKECQLSPDKVEILSKKLYSDLYGMGVLQELDDDIDVSEIMVNASAYPTFRCDIYYTKTNQPKKKYNKTFDNLNDLMNVFARTISFAKKEMNNSENASIETTRANGDRVSLIIPEASDNYLLNIRKFANFVPSRENMLEVGTINEEIDELMDIMVKGKANIGIGGEMGTGKTTFINYLLTYTKPIERKAIIANVKEVNSNNILDNHDIIFLNVDEEKGFSFEKQMRIALRTTADRIILPETRGGEFKQVYEANLKTKGNIFTAHATDDEFFIDVCADMYMESSPSDITFIKNKISKSIDMVLIMKKVNDKIRIKSISEVLVDEKGRYGGLNNLYYWDFKESKYVRSLNRVTDDLREKLFEEGISELLLEKI